MEYFKSLTSAVLAQTGGPFPNFTLGERNARFEGKTIWSLHAGTKRDDGSAVSILVFDASAGNRRALLPLAQNAARKLRTMRHPDVLRFIDSAEAQTAVYIAVEPVRPLADMLAEGLAPQALTEWVGWGLSRLANALKFINVDASSVHGNVRIESIFLASSGEWKMGGFETLTSTKEEDSGVFYTLGNLVPDAQRILPPEARQGGCSALRGMPPHVVDAYGLALAGFEAYNGTLPPTSGVPAQGKVPAPFYAIFKRMLTPNAKTRASTAQFLELGQAEGGYFATNRLVQVSAGIDNFLLAAEGDRSAIVRTLEASPESFPAPFVQYKVLPVLLNALSYQPNPQTTTPTSLQGAKLIPLCLKLAKAMPEAEWRKAMSEPIVKAYASPDRGMRMALLENLDAYAERLDSKVVVDKIWFKLITGLSDSVAAIREATLKAILPLAPKLSDRILNNDLLRVLAKTQTDIEPSIRTNTTILIGRLVPFLSANTKKTVLVPAFARSLKDPFVHARVAGLTALIATGDSFDAADVARQVLPAAMPCLMDSEKVVRDQANKAVDVFLQRVREAAKLLPDTVLPPEGSEASSAANAVASLRLNPSAASATNAASVLAGWAMSSAMSQFSRQTSASELQNTSLDTNSATASASTLTPKDEALPISPQRANGFRAHSSTASASSSLGALSPTLASGSGAAEVDEWGAMDDTPLPSSAAAGAAAARAGLPGIVGGSKKLALGGAKKKASLADTILAESSGQATRAGGGGGSRAASFQRAPSAVTAPALAVQQPPALAADEDDAWGESWDAGAGGGGAAPAANGHAHGMADSTELTAAAFSDPPAEPQRDTWAAPEPEPEPQPVVAADWDAAAAEEGDGGDGDESAAAAQTQAPAAPKVLTKEEKRAEMQRQREERKARMAALKAAKGA